MRFLERNDAGQISLTRNFINYTPQYAVLSHTWGADEEEVSFADMMDGTGKSKLGYRKIRFCADQAWHDGLRFFWMDTCCIDKSSSAELQESINSMFRWYHGATKCYVYLADVLTAPPNANDRSSPDPAFQGRRWLTDPRGFIASALSTRFFGTDVRLSDGESLQQHTCATGDTVVWEPAFPKSRWFTRAWTLQELVAPTSVEFFSKEGTFLGDKKSLERHIHDVTGIPLNAIRGSCLYEFSIPERMKWMEKRNATREEDRAYSLLGIFGVSMPALYGEGEKSAFRRLKEEIYKTSRSKQVVDAHYCHHSVLR